jgi:hypothetical protein
MVSIMFTRSILALVSLSFASILAGCSGPAPDASTSTSVSQAESGADAKDCGPRLIGPACQTADGSCEDLVCSEGNWVCPRGDVQVPLTPLYCAPHPTDCGPRLLGSTCQTAAGSCESLVCSDGNWVCPEGDVEVPLTPQNCVH